MMELYTIKKTCRSPVDKILRRKGAIQSLSEEVVKSLKSDEVEKVKKEKEAKK